MELLTLFQKAYRVRRFIIVQFIALVGWIIVQSSFSLTPAGQSIPFQVMIVSEGIWWIALLAVMLTLFTHEYKSFERGALELEEANKQLREATNRLFVRMQDQEPKEEHPILPHEVPSAPPPAEEPVSPSDEESVLSHEKLPEQEEPVSPVREEISPPEVQSEPEPQPAEETVLPAEELS